MSPPDVMHPHAAGFDIEADREHVVVLLHGWTGSPAHFRPVAEDIVAAGFGVRVPLLAGHGTRVEHMVGTGWRDWVASAIETAAEAESTGARIHFAGLSMGGLIGLLLANSFDAVSVTTINSPIYVHNRRMPFAGFLRGSNRIDEYPPDDWPEGFAVDYAHQYAGRPVGTVAELRDIIRAARLHLPMVTAPALVIQSRTDETVKPKSGTYIYDHLGSVMKRMLWLQRSRHVATLDAERDLIGEELVAHLRQAVQIIDTYDG